MTDYNCHEYLRPIASYLYCTVHNGRSITNRDHDFDIEDYCQRLLSFNDRSFITIVHSTVPRAPSASTRIPCTLSRKNRHIAPCEALRLNSLLQLQMTELYNVKVDNTH